MSVQVGTLTITHTAADGTLIEGTERGDGTNVVLKANGWRWSRTLGAWYVPRSRDVNAPTVLIEQTTTQLRSEGFTVEVDIDQARRSTAEVETDRIARQAERVDRLTAKAEKVAADAETADQAANELSRRVPFGQPILVGHHSERRMTRHYENVERSQRKAVELGRAADQAAEAAETASHTTGARYSAITVGNRIEKIEAGIRATDRALAANPSDGYRAVLTERRAELADQLTYWQQVRADQIASGAATDYGPDTIRPGDMVKIGRDWHRVLRANRKTVTVPTPYSWTDTAPYRHITGHRPAAQDTTEHTE